MLAPVVNHQGDGNEEEDDSRNVIIQPSRKSGHCCRFASSAVICGRLWMGPAPSCIAWTREGEGGGRRERGHARIGEIGEARGREKAAELSARQVSVTQLSYAHPFNTSGLKNCGQAGTPAEQSRRWALQMPASSGQAPGLLSRTVAARRIAGWVRNTTTA